MNPMYDLYTRKYLTNFRLTIDKTKVNMHAIQVHKLIVIGLGHLGHNMSNTLP